MSGSVPVLPLYAFMACTIKLFLSALHFFKNYVRLLRTSTEPIKAQVSADPYLT